MNSQPTIRDFTKDDFLACAKIYNDGIQTGIATFETTVPDWEVWNEKFLKRCSFVAVDEKFIVGWIALTPFSSREVYKGVVEVTLYIAQEVRGQKIGKQLLEHLIMESKKAGFWTLQAKIFPQNRASLSLFSKCKFREVGIRERVAMRDGIWYDNVLMELRM